MVTKSKPSVFIIESLNFEDEDENLLEGKILSQILHLGGKQSQYYYYRTKKELKELLKLFTESKYRYLHISCHATSNTIHTTLDNMTFPQFAKIANPHLANKRLFISACKAVNSTLAKAIIPSSKCRSIVGPARSIHFDDAAIMWASFYHLVFNMDSEKISLARLKRALQKSVNAFEVPFNIYARSKETEKGYKPHPIKPEIDDDTEL